MEEKREEFEVVDRRRVNAEAATAAQPEATAAAAEATEEAVGPAAQGAPPEEEEEAETDDEGGPEPGLGRMPDVDVYSLLGSFVGMLHGFAWQRMGVVANPATGQIETDLDQARVAIDTVQFMAERLEKKLPPAEVREVRRLVMDLQMNFVRRSSSGGG